MTMSQLPLEVGEIFAFAKTITETDFAFFTAISGDVDPLHVNERHAQGTRFGRRIAPGLLSMALLSTTASMASTKARERGFAGIAVSLGYDRIRFVHPVHIGDTLEARYTVEALDTAKARSVATVEVRNQSDDLCVVGQHIMAWQAS